MLTRLLAADTIITFDEPGAGKDPFEGTQPVAINPSGLIAGLYSDASNASHGFVCDTNGAIITLDVPGEGTGSDGGPVAWSINPGGVIAGDVIDPGFSANHGIMRTVAMLSVIDCVVDCVPFAI